MSKLLKLIVNLFLVAAIVVAVAILVPPLLGVTTTIIDTESLNTNLPLGSVTYSEEMDVQSLSQGDEILKEDADSTYAYVIVEGDADSGKYMVIDPSKKGEDDNVVEVTLRNYVSRIIFTVPYIGYVMVAMHSTEGIIIIGLLVLFVIILFILSELWKKRDDEEEEEEGQEEPEEEADEPSEEEAGDAEADDSGSRIGEDEERSRFEDDVDYALGEHEIKEGVLQIVNGSDDAGDVEPADYQGQEGDTRTADIIPERDDSADGDTGEGAYPFPDEADEDVPEERESFGNSFLKKEEEDSYEEEEEPELDDDKIIPVERLTLDEIFEEVKKSGKKPLVRKDPITGIEIVDLSEIIR